uniref:Uncharacterized protein n=1 Tax=Myoviridae sp. ctTK08 TaxID=2826656 RepID=A0A8S5QXC8_9CAUD|nr:MAG TPA: hypothetical protein [Myoviridae sp. ctTK08]
MPVCPSRQAPVPLCQIRATIEFPHNNLPRINHAA